MSTLGNIIWLVFGGFFAGLGYMVGGAFLCLTIVGIPLGVPIIQLGIATMSPFGREVVEEETAGGLIEVILNALWVIFFGWELALNHLFWTVLLGISIIGIPFAQQHIKLIPISLFPFGKRLQ